MDYADAVQKFYLLNPAALVIECPTSDAEEIKTFYTLTKTTPLLAVSARPDEDTAIAAYQNGATTFIRLPCGSREFYYRLFSILKNAIRSPSTSCMPLSTSAISKSTPKATGSC